MQILYYTWFENSASDMAACLSQAGHKLHIIHIKFKDYNQDDIFCTSLKKELCSADYDCIFSFNFFPLISKVAMEAGIAYISWIYDTPHITLCSPEVYHPINHIFVFDYQQFLTLQNRGISKVYHLPLGVNTQRLNHLLGTAIKNTRYSIPVSFVGSLYENCHFNQFNYLPDYIKGYLEGIMRVQQLLYGYNLISDVITSDIVTQLNQFISLDIPLGYQLTNQMLYCDMINSKITSLERIHLLREISSRFPLSLFTGSDSALIPGAKFGGYVSYDEKMPDIFRHSNINLNITLRSITSGIPLRALDILGAGGFLLSNYQPELALYLKDGEDMVLFESTEDLLTKIEYYLSHEKERMEIAQNGWQKIQTEFSYDLQISKMMEIVFS